MASTTPNALRLIFERANPNIGGTYYECDQLGMWFENGIGGTKDEAYFVWFDNGECMKHSIKLQKISEGHLFNTRKFKSLWVYCDVHFHKLQLFPDVSIHLKIKVDQEVGAGTSRDFLPFVFEYVSENELVELASVEKSPCVSSRSDEDILKAYLDENIRDTYVISPDHKFAIVGELDVGVFMICAEHGKIKIFDYLYHDHYNPSITKELNCYLWFGEKVRRISRPIINSDRATFYYKQFDEFDHPYYTEFDLKLIPDF